jgi:MFS family permease
MGRLGDLTGIRKMFKTGLVIFTFASLLCGLAVSGTWLIVFRFLQGIGAALTSTTGPAILVAAFLPQHRGRVLGISVSAVYLGLAFGPFAGGILTQFLGWRSLFFLAFGAGSIAVLITFLFLGKDEFTEKARHKIDLKGTFFYMLSLVMLLYGSSRIPETLGWGLMAGGVGSMMFFWWIESRSAIPVINTQLFTKNRLFAFSNLAALINYSATFAIVFLLSLYLQKIKGLSPSDAGLILIAQPVVMALFSPVAGRLSDRIQPRYLTTAGMSMCTIGLVAFATLSATTPIGIIVGILVWVGTGFALFSSPNMNTIMGSVSKTQLGIASGSAATMRVVGQIVSMTIATLFFAAMFGNQTVEAIAIPLFIKAVKWAFITFSLISIIGIYLSFNRGVIT